MEVQYLKYIMQYLAILTCTVADIITLPIMFCQSRLVLQNSLTNFRSRIVFTQHIMVLPMF